MNINTKKENSVYLEDGVSKIDAILVYNKTVGVNEVNVFFENLKKTGLVLKYVPLTTQPDLIFVQIHAPAAVLLKYSDVYSIPFRKDQNIIFPQPEVSFTFLENILNTPRPDPNDPVSKRAWRTISKQPPTEITVCERSAIVFLIMDYIQFGNNDFEVGLRQLLHQDIILDAYPLHDGPWEWPDDPNEPLNDRQLLSAYWANFSMFFKEQPLDTVKHYLGYEMAMYFAWLGLYNKMLMFASVFGFFSFIGGIFFVNSYTDDILKGFCNHTGVMCNKMLLEAEDIDHLEAVSSTCHHIYFTYINSNLVTCGYSCAIVLWCTIFKEAWKRQFNVQNAQWGNPDIEDFVLRPQFIANAKHIRPHIYTGEPELYFSFFEQFMRYTFSIFGTIIMLLLVIGTIIASIYLELYLLKLHYPRVQIIVINCCISLFFMIILEIIFNNNLLQLMSKIEMPRTELTYEKSVIIKSLLFLSFNSYGRLMYIAFFKGKNPYFQSVFSRSHDKERYHIFPSSYCLPPSCVFEVVCLLITILILKPIFLNLIETSISVIKGTLKRRKLSLDNITKGTRWECDYILPTLDNRMLNDLNKLIIQFGYVTFFAASCPLVPLVTLIYNLITVRLDAMKVVRFSKRSIERKRVTSIGICFDIFETMAYVAIIINALYMAYTCRFIHMYHHYNSSNATGMDPTVVNEFSNVTYDYYTSNTSSVQECVLSGFYEKYGDKLVLSVEHYDFLTRKGNLALAFMLLGFFVSGILSYAIPDVPRDLQEFIHYHKELEKDKDL